MACDVVLNGITGAVGLRPTVAALESGNTLALANKESLIIGGPVVTALAMPGQIVPVDSEHSALAQCLRGGRSEEVRRLVLTASGGPFRGRTREQLAAVTPEEALNHPTWDMGPVVTINSATLVNKGLEVIEAHLLFGIDYDCIEVVVHPQSMIHSMVEFTDGSTLAQVSPPDMHLPISLALSWPDRLPGFMGLVLRKSLTVRGFIQGEFTASHGRDFARDMPGWVADGSVRTLVHTTLPLEEVREAHRVIGRMGSPEHAWVLKRSYGPRELRGLMKDWRRGRATRNLARRLELDAPYR